MIMLWIRKSLKLYANNVVRHLQRSIWIVITMCSLNGYVQAQENTGFVVDEIIAKVDNYIILKSDLDRIYQDYLSNGNSPSQEAKCHFLVVLIRNKLMLAKAEIDSVVVEDE